MATGGQSSSQQPQDPLTTLTQCPHCESLCLGPCLLPCGHVLCRMCLHDVLQFVDAVCPRCEQPLRRLPGDKALTTRQLIQQTGTDTVIDHLVWQELEKVTDTCCLNCPNRKATKVCLDCQDYFCEVCSLHHLNCSSWKDHVLRLLPNALQNVSSAASVAPRPRSPSVVSVSSLDSICNVDDQQSRGVSCDKSEDVKKGKKWMKAEVGLLQQVSSEHQEKINTLQNIESLVQELRNRVEAHQQVLDTYHLHLSGLDITQSTDGSSYVVKPRDSDVSLCVEAEPLKRRLCDVRKGHCPSFVKLNRIMAHLKQLVHCEDEENSGSSSIHTQMSTTASSTQTSITTPQPHPPLMTPRVDLLKTTPQKVFQVSPRADQDTEKPRITAIVCLPDDRLVMTDFNNKTVKVMNLKPPHVLSASPTIPETPRRLAVLPDDLVAVTTHKRVIFLIDVTNIVHVVSEIQTDQQYDGIAAQSEGLLIVSCAASSQSPAAVDVLTRQGQRVRTLTDSSVVLNSPEYLCPFSDQHILLSDWQLHVVYKIDICSGQVTQTFHHTDMKGPQQVCADSDGNMFVACTDTKCVMVRNRDGQWRELVTHSEGWPWGVCLTRSGHLVVSWGRSSIDSVVISYKLR